jgi:amidase
LKLTDDLTINSATELARLIRTRAASPVEVMEAYLGRIEALNPRLNAIVTLAPDLLERARRAESEVMKGEALGALHGVPLTIKDTIETVGLRTTSGSRARAEYIPHRDAPAVARLKAAGAILLGKTNVSEMALDYESDNPLFGRSRNPHNYGRTPGGSSGGEAAAIGARLSPAGLGSDLSGSIRIPAHFCGIVGLKPTAGSVPAPGQFPPSVGPYSLGSTIGPMARRVEDLSLIFNLIAGAREKLVAAPLESAARRPSLKGLRVAWYTDDQVSPVTESTRAAVKAAVGALEAAGLLASEHLPPGIERGPGLWMALFSRAILEPLRATYSGREMEAGELPRFLLKSFAARPSPSMDELLSAWTERDRLRGALLEWMAGVPLLVAPVGATHAFEHGARRLNVCGQSVSVFRAFSYAQTFNVYGLPSVCVPAARAPEDGLPVGVQIVGRPFEEGLVLAAAAIVEEALGGWQAPAPAPLALSPEGENPL